MTDEQKAMELYSKILAMVPEGYEIERVGSARKGDRVMFCPTDGKWGIYVFDCDDETGGCEIIIRPKAAPAMAPKPQDAKPIGYIDKDTPVGRVFTFKAKSRPHPELAEAFEVHYQGLNADGNVKYICCGCEDARPFAPSLTEWNSILAPNVVSFTDPAPAAFAETPTDKPGQQVQDTAAKLLSFKAVLEEQLETVKKALTAVCLEALKSVNEHLNAEAKP